MRKTYDYSDEKFYAKEVWDAANTVDIVQMVLSSPAIQVKMINGRYTARCFSPDHNDTHASLYINDVGHGNYIYCFGCGKVWKPIQFVQWEYNCSPREALEIIINNHPEAFIGLDVSPTAPSKKWKGLSPKDFEKLGLPNSIYFNSSENKTDCITMKDLALKNSEFYAEIVNDAIFKKYQELVKIRKVSNPHDTEIHEIIDKSMDDLERIKKKIPLTY